MNLAFEHPQMLLLALPWIAFWWWFAEHQRSSWQWIQKRISPRFRGALSSHTRTTLEVHLGLLLLMGLLLILAGTQPIERGGGEFLTDGGRVLLLFDGSASMYAADVEPEWQLGRRFEVARDIAKRFVLLLPDHHFSLASFSGVATFHLPMTDDRELLKEALRTIEIHTFYQNSGSSFANALDAALRLAEQSDEPFQVVILSDGEQPFPEAYEEPLEALARLDIPVHGLAIGSPQGQARLIYDQRDIVAKKPREEQRVLSEYTTRRVDEHLERMAEETDGEFAVATSLSVSRLIETVRERPQSLRDDEANADLSHLPLGLFLALFLVDLTLARPRRPTYAFDIERLGRRPVPRAASASALLLLLFSCGHEDPTQLAHEANESGILRDTGGLHAQAQKAYRRSLGFQVEPHIPTYNLARSATLQEDFSTARKLYQDALELEPRLTEAYYNDGIVLFRWGQTERDPDNCQLDRTLDFWKQAHRRFETALDLAGSEDKLSPRIEANLEAASQSIRQLEDLIANPPPACLQGGSPDQAENPPQQGSSQAEQGQNQQGQNQQGQSQQEQEPEGQGQQNQQEQNQQGQNQQEQNQQGQNQQGQNQQEQNQQAPSGQGQQNQQEQNQPNQGSSPPPTPDAESQAPAEQPLSDGDREAIVEALSRIRNQRLEEGKFHRRTLPEQFAKETWGNPDPDIWW